MIRIGPHISRVLPYFPNTRQTQFLWTAMRSTFITVLGRSLMENQTHLKSDFYKKKFQLRNKRVRIWNWWFYTIYDFSLNEINMLWKIIVWNFYNEKKNCKNLLKIAHLAGEEKSGSFCKPYVKQRWGKMFLFFHHSLSETEVEKQIILFVITEVRKCNSSPPILNRGG